MQNIGAALVEGTPFGKYRLVALLGRGGMGEVWRAFDTETDRIVALKVLPAHLADDETFQSRFRREARAAAGLYEPHVVPIHGYGEIDGRLYVDMRLIVGRDLDAMLREGPLDPARAVMIVEQVASALHAAHQINLVHRDVKPSNILLTDDDFAYLIDFGIARVAGETGLTSTGSTIGTWAYMAPERFGAGEADHRADVYALACVLHQCLTGQLPFPGQNVEQQVAGHLTTPPPRPSAINSGVPQAFDDVIAKGMAKNPDERYTTTRELAQSAQAALRGTREPIPQLTPVTVAPPITQSAEPQHQGAITGSSSSATSDTDSGTSLVDAVPEYSNAEVLPSHHAPEVAIDPAADTRTHAGPTVSASDAPTQQAPPTLSASDLPKHRPAAKPAALGGPQPESPKASLDERPPFQRLSQGTKVGLVAFASLVVVAVVIAIAVVVGHKSPGGVVASSTSTTESALASGQTSQVSCGGKKTLIGSGSTAQANGMTWFINAFEQACPGQTLNYTANGSGAGITEFTGNQTDFAGSDSPLPQNQYAAAQQRCGSPAWNLPVVFGPIAITYNVNTVTSLNLDGPTLAKIFNGAITTWNDPAIQALNNGFTLPGEPIHVVFRNDSRVPRTTSRSTSTPPPTAPGARAPERPSKAVSVRPPRATTAPRRPSRPPKDRSPTTNGRSPRIRI